jgi:translation initiation factor IF-2
MKLPEPRKQEPKKPVASSSDDSLKSKKKKRKRIKKQGEGQFQPGAKETDQQAKPAASTPGQPGQGQQKQPYSRPPGTTSPNYKGNKDKKGGPRRDMPKVELSPEDIQKQIKETLQRLSGSGKSKA